MGGAGTVLRYLKMPERAPQSTEASLSDDFIELSEDEEMLSESQFTASDGHSEPSENRYFEDHDVPRMTDWEHKALSKATLSRKFEPVPLIMTISIGGAAVVSTIYGMESRIQVVTYIMAAMVFILTNPLHSVERMLAIPSRVMLAITLFMVDMAITFPEKNMILASLIVCFVLIMIVRLGNQKWLIQEIYLATEFTRKAQTIDSEDLPFLSWRAHGKRELWTALEQAGLTVSENELNYGYRIAWRHGYIIGMTMVETKNRRIGALEEYVEELEAELDEKETELERVAWWKGQMRDTDEQIAGLEADLRTAQEDNRYYESQMDIIEKRESAYREQLENLRKENAELRESGTTEADKEDLVRRMLETGISYRNIESVTGMNKYKIGEVKKKFNIELQREKVG